MNTIKKFGVFTSSVDPNKLGATVQSAILGASVYIIYLAHIAGLNIITSQVSDLAVELGSIVTTVFVLFGLIRKVVVFFSTLNKPVTPPTVQTTPTL
jgi:hypothetical protein